MAIKVTLQNASRVTRRTPDQEKRLIVSRLTYQYLGSLIRNKELISLYDSGKLPEEYVRTLDELNDLYLVKNYPGLASGIVLSPDIEALDEYLGSLGLSEEYPYSKDAVDVPAWATFETPSELRVLVDSDTETFLVTSNNEVLVNYRKG